MMREILFRGKRVDNGEWVEGCYIKANHHWHEHGTHEDWIAVDAIQNGGWCNVGGKYAVLPETVGQYTGLRDCKRTEEYPKGQMIFEGDVLRTENSKHNYVVRYCDKRAIYELRRVDDACGSNGIWKDISEECEVIGNIHDNPELLGGGEDA